MGDCLQVGGRQKWGVANRKSLNCVQNPDLPVETWLDFPYEVNSVLSLDLSLARVRKGSSLNPLGRVPQSRSSQSD